MNPSLNEPTPDTLTPDPEHAGRLQDLQAELAAARQTIDKLDRRQQITSLLARTDTIDLELARLLTEAAVEQMDEPDIRLAIDDLRRDKPYLFRRSPAAAQSPAHDPSPERSVDQAARQAAESGNRNDLLRYLRLRRRSVNA